MFHKRRQFLICWIIFSCSWRNLYLSVTLFILFIFNQLPLPLVGKYISYFVCYSLAGTSAFRCHSDSFKRDKHHIWPVHVYITLLQLIGTVFVLRHGIFHRIHEKDCICSSDSRLDARFCSQYKGNPHIWHTYCNGFQTFAPQTLFLEN
jgi:hypothetical protein